jgi:hypothetical protein
VINNLRSHKACLFNAILRYDLRRAEEEPMRVIDPDDSTVGGVSSFFLTQSKSIFEVMENKLALELKFNIPSDTMDVEVNRGIVGLVGSAASQVPAALCEAVRRAGEALMEAKIDGKPVLNYEQHSDLIPWLPWPDRRLTVADHFDYVTLSGDEVFVLGAFLMGQGLSGLRIKLGDVYLAKFIQLESDPFRVVPLMSFELTSLEFEEGSIKAKLGATMRSVAAVSALMSLPYITPQVNKIINHEIAVVQMHSVVKQATQGQPMESFCETRLSFDGLENARDTALNYHQKGISETEKKCRVAQLQTLLKIALNIDLAVDGIAGPETHKAEQDFAHKFNIQGTSESRAFRGKLAQVVDDLIQKKAGGEKEV